MLKLRVKYKGLSCIGELKVTSVGVEHTFYFG